MGKTFTLHGGNSGGVYAKLVVTEQSQSIENNTTTLLWQFYMWNTQAKPNWYAYEQHNIIQVKINGIYVLNTSNFGLIGLEPEMTEATAELVTSGTTVINHNTDGSKTVDLSFYATQGWVNAYEWSGSQNSAALTTIARASQPTLSASSVTLGSPVTIYTNRASTGFTHTLEYSIGSASGTIASGVGDRYDDWKPSEELARQFPNVTSGTVTITCKTYNGSKHIGTETALLKVEISEDMVPSVSVVISEAASIPSGITGYIKTRSKLRIKVNASGSYGSSITSYKVTANGSTDNKSEIITGYLTTAGKNTITVTVTDSRGQPKTYETSVTVTDYSAPKISSLKAFRCDSGGNEDVTGANMKVVVAGSVTSLSSKNAKTCTLYYKKASATSWTSQTLTLSAYSFENVSAIVSADTSSSYNVRVAIGDSFSSAEYHSAVGTAQMFMNVLADKSGAAIGKMAEKANTLQLGWDLELKGDPTEDKHATTKKYVDIKAKRSLAHLYSESGAINGDYYCKIKFNTPHTYYYMFSFTLRVYQGYRATDFLISGYHYGSNHWHAPSAVMLGDNSNDNMNVYFGYDSDGKLWLAFSAANYIGVDIFNFTNGFAQLPEGWYEDLFTITLESSLSGNTQATITAEPPYYRGQTVDNANNAAALALPRVDGVDALAYALALPEGSTTTIYFGTGCTNLPIDYLICRISRTAYNDCTITATYVGNGNTYRNVTSNGGASWTGWVLELDTGSTSDYPVAFGTSGIWTYRKWNSGFAECWCKLPNVSTAFSSTWGNLYIHDYVFPAQAYPFTFLNEPQVWATPSCANTSLTGDFWIYGGSDGSKTSSPALSAARPSKPASAINLSIALYVVGQWK